LDPAYAEPYAGMAECDSYLSSWLGVAISIDEILATTGKALAIEPNLAEAHAARGHALVNAGRRAEAVSAFEQSLALDPNCHEANYYYGRFCYTEGDFAAAKHYIRALEIQLTTTNRHCTPAYLKRSDATTSRKIRTAGIRGRYSTGIRKFRSGGDGCRCVGGSRRTRRAMEWLSRALAVENDLQCLVQYRLHIRCWSESTAPLICWRSGCRKWDPIRCGSRMIPISIPFEATLAFRSCSNSATRDRTT
jgi:adenylate cyclase